MSSCSFTGHRPEKLGGYDYNSEKNMLIKEKLSSILEHLINNKKVDTFYVGGALGFDQMSFDVLYELKETKYNYIKIIVSVPFKNQDNNWPQKSKDYYKNQLKRATEVIYVDTLEEYKIKNYEEDIYYPAKMQKRNEHMVDNSEFLIACYDGTSGGTGNCVKYWNKNKNSENLFIIDPNNLGDNKIKDNLNTTEQIYKKIPIRLIDVNYEGKKAKKYNINNTKQSVWIPNVYLEVDGTLKSNVNLDFVFFSNDGLNKLKIAGININKE